MKELLFLIAMLVIDLSVQYYLIVRKKIVPNHTLFASIRIALTLVLILVLPIEGVSAILRLFVYFLFYNFWFSSLLNEIRREAPFYRGVPDPRPLKTILLEALKGKHSILDQIDMKLLPDGPSFIFKFFLSIGAIMLILKSYSFGCC